MAIRIGMLSSLGFTLMVFGALSTDIYACNCQPTSNCANYMRAEGIYKGRLVRIEPNTQSIPKTVNLHFEVHQNYKGKKEATVELRFLDSPCLPVWTIGQDYLVYREAQAIQSICNETRLVSNSKHDLEYLDRMRSDSPLLSILGVLKGLSDAQERTAHVKIRWNQNEEEPKIDEIGLFRAVLSERRKYRVVITVPFRAEVLAKDGALDLTDGLQIKVGDKTTIVEYEVDLRTGFCDSREIEFVELS